MNSHEGHTHNLQRLLKTSLLAGLGMYFTYNIISGNLANYINARFAWLSYLAAALFFILAFVGVWSQRQQDHQHDGHQHSHTTSWWMLLIVSLPLLFGTLLPSQPLGAEAIGGDVRTSAISINTTITLTSNPLDWNILDWLRQFSYSTDLSTFNGQQADVIGFVYREPDFPKDHFMVVRLAVSCCVADSSAIGLPVFSNDLTVEAIADGEWVRAEGTFQVGEFQQETIPILHLTAIEVVEQPAQPYLNP